MPSIAQFVVTLVIGTVCILSVSLIGHLIWVGLGGLVGRIFPRARCNRCGAPSLILGTCSQCDRMPIEPSVRRAVPSLESDLQAADRLLQYARFQRLLDDEEINLLEAKLLGLRPTNDRAPAEFAPKSVSESPKSADQNQAALESFRDLAIDAGQQNTANADIAGFVLPAQSDSSSATSVKPAMDESIIEASFAVNNSVSSTEGKSRTGSLPVHPLDQDILEERLGPSWSQRRDVMTASVMRSFMERSNIRWIEIVSAAMVVICSVGLVISLWSTLSQTSRFFPSLVFMLATVAVHGAGQYTLRKWKLRTTSRGILHIGLMLIPLATLIGIQLASRNHDLQWDFSTVAVVVVGTIVYGALAVTATRSLFTSQGLFVAVSTVVASLTLVAIRSVSSGVASSLVVATAILVPLLMVNGWASLAMSLRCRTRMHYLAAFTRRHLGQAVEILFASIIVLVFWYLQFKESSFHFSWWWSLVGLLATFWISWGWTVTSCSFVEQPASGNQQRVGQKAWAEMNWFAIIGLGVAVVGGCVLMASLWQASHHRPSHACLLLLGGVIASLHGVVCRIRGSIALGSYSILLGFALLGDYAFSDSMELTWKAWITFERVTWLTITGSMLTLVGGLLAFSKSTELSTEPVFQDRVGRSKLPSLTKYLGEQWVISGLLGVLTASCLTVIASFVDGGPTPRGGNWAPVVLGVDCVIVTLLALMLEGRWISSQRLSANPHRLWSHWLMPVGQSLGILATIRFCHTSDFAPEFIQALRPSRAWAIGLLMLGSIWSGLAMFLRRVGYRSGVEGKHSTQTFRNVDWLVVGSVIISSVSAFAVWTAGDHLLLATEFGWCLVLTAMGAWLVWRVSFAREATTIALCVWGSSCLHFIGWRFGWWQESILATATAAHVCLCSLISIAILIFWKRTDRDSVVASSLEGWANGILAIGGWCALAATLFLPCLHGLAVSFGFPRLATQLPFIHGAPTLLEVGILIIANGLVGWNLWLASQRIRLPKMAGFIGLLPITLAMSVSVHFGGAWTLPVALWVLAGSVIASELIPFTRKSWHEKSDLAWVRQSVLSSSKDSDCLWLAIGRAISVALIFFLTIIAVLRGWTGNLHETLYPAFGSEALSQLGTIDKIIRLSAWLGPLLSVCLTRWLLGKFSESGRTTSPVAAIVASVVIGCVASFLATEATASCHFGLVVMLQSIAICAAAIGFMDLGISVWRGTRQSFQPVDQLPPANRQDEDIFRTMLAAAAVSRDCQGWVPLAITAMLALSGLAIAGMFGVITYPISRSMMMDAFDSWPTVVALVLPITLFSVVRLSNRRSAFGLLALALGLAAPLVAVLYANWLDAVPARHFVDAKNFEPWRMQLGGWLAALFVGLLYRLRVAGKVGSQASELLWVGLGGLVGCIALVSIPLESNAAWPAGQLSILALVAVLSGMASNQAWRTHLAAAIAGAGIVAWHWTGNWLPIVDLVWSMLWGPVWVACVALVWHLTLLHGARASEVSLGRRWGWQTTVDQTVSLHVPIAICLISGMWNLINDARFAQLHLAAMLGLAIVTFGLSVSRLWDTRSGKRGLSVYLSVLALAASAAVFVSELNGLRVYDRCLIWMSFELLALGVMAACVREWMRESKNLLPALNLGAIHGEPGAIEAARRWMVVLHTWIGCMVVGPAMVLVIGFEERGLRLASAALPLISALSILPIAVDTRRLPRALALVLLTCAGVLVSWGDVSTGPKDVLPAIWHYGLPASVALMAMGWGYLGIRKWMKKKLDWPVILSAASGLCMGAGALGASLILLIDWSGAPVLELSQSSLEQQLSMLAVWCGVIVRCLFYALWPQVFEDRATIAQRKGAIYLVELGLVLFAATAHSCFPELFQGVFRAWWPLIVYAVAFLSLGLSEWSYRRGHEVIADPVGRSCLLLPIVPLVGVWWGNADGTIVWTEWQWFSILLLTSGAVYAIHGWSRDLLVLKILAGLLGLLSFWTLLHSNPTTRFLEHPQFWLLPPAVVMLGFVEANRGKLSTSVVSASRYASILIIYLSSTADMLLRAFDGQLWQPIVLLLLAVGGMLLGIALRVRAFLYCGAAFTLVALLGMVWHAQQAIDQVWPWWAFGILMGITLITLLGFFEKNRPRAMAYLEQLKRWDA